MTRQVRFEAEASSELGEAALWYESRRKGLGLAFLGAVDRAIEAIVRWPDAGSPVPQVASPVLHRLRLLSEAFVGDDPLNNLSLSNG